MNLKILTQEMTEVIGPVVSSLDSELQEVRVPRCAKCPYIALLKPLYSPNDRQPSL